jgi:predicted RNA methylase
VAGRQVADIGSGTGRIVAMLLAAGAARVTAIEPSRAFEVLAPRFADDAKGGLPTGAGGGHRRSRSL